MRQPPRDSCSGGVLSPGQTATTPTLSSSLQGPADPYERNVLSILLSHADSHPSHVRQPLQRSSRRRTTASGSTEQARTPNSTRTGPTRAPSHALAHHDLKPLGNHHNTTSPAVGLTTEDWVASGEEDDSISGFCRGKPTTEGPNK